MVPVPQAGQKPIVPFGGEVFSIGNTTPAREQATWDFIAWLQNPSILVPLDFALGYVPAYAPADKQYVQQHPEFTAFAQELQHSMSRTSILGTKYGGASQAIWTAIQKAMNGTSPQSALSGRTEHDSGTLAPILPAPGRRGAVCSVSRSAAGHGRRAPKPARQ